MPVRSSSVANRGLKGRPEKVHFSVGCLFAAIGGFAKAFQSVGARVRWANEKDAFATQTFEANFPNIRCILKPVEALGVKTDELEPVDILTAGFPCQPFSVAGEKRGFQDERGTLFLQIIRLLNEFGRDKPKILLLENVQNFRSHDRGRTFKRVQAEIQKAGYWFGEQNAAILNTAIHTDIPQNRPRVFMVAMNSDHFSSNTFAFPEEIPRDSLRKVREFLDVQQKQDPYFYFTEESQYFSIFQEAISNGDRNAVYQLRRSYVRENRSGMCFTLMANMGEGGHNQPVIKDRWGIRKLTPPECARLQGWDESFVIPEELSRSQIYKQIGNSVTIPLVERLARTCVAQLKKTRAKSHGAPRKRTT